MTNNQGNIKEAEMMAKQDGYNHINTDSIFAKTKLGCKLDFIERTPFVHPQLGTFTSMEGFLGFITAREIHDELRYLSGVKAKKANRKVDRKYLQDMVKYLVVAEWHKVVQNHELAELMMSSEAPFAQYYIRPTDSGPMVIMCPMYSILTKVHEEVRRLIKNGEEPPALDYTAILNRPRHIACSFN